MTYNGPTAKYKDIELSLERSMVSDLTSSLEQGILAHGEPRANDAYLSTSSRGWKRQHFQCLFALVPGGCRWTKVVT